MTIERFLFGTRTFAVTLFVAGLCIFAPMRAHAQSSAPNVDECSSEVVDTNYDVEEWNCLSGDATTLDSYSEVDSNDTTGTVAGVEAQEWIGLFPGGSGYQTDWSQSGGSEADIDYEFAPQVNAYYTLFSSYGECFDWTESDDYSNCSWEGGQPGPSVMAEVTSLPTPALTLTTSGSPSVNGTPVTFTATISNGLTGTVIFYNGPTGNLTQIGTATINGTIANSTTSSLGYGDNSISAYWPGNSSFSPVMSSSLDQLVDSNAVTVYTWPTASAIAWGQSLASSTLSGGTASVSGTFAWTTPSTIPTPGTQSENVTFTPSDTTDYTATTSSTSVTVNALTLSSPTINTGVQVINGGGPALVPLGNGLYSSALELVYVDTSQDLRLAYSTDGLHYTDSDPGGYGIHLASSGNPIELDCTPAYSDHCGVTAAALNGQLYVAYNDYSCNCLHVLAGTPVPNYAVFQWADVYDDTAHQLVTTPAMLVVPVPNQQNPNLIVRYGTTEGDHEAYSSVLNGGDGEWSTQDSDSTSRTQSTLFTIDGTNYAIDLSNPDYSGALHITELDDNGVAIPGTTYQLQGGDSGNITQGFSSTVYNGYGHCAFVTSMPPESDELQIFSTSDYYNFADGGFWGPQTYSNIQEVPYESDYPGDFAISVYPPQPSGSAQIVVVYSGDSNGDLYATSGTPPATCP